jgi:selenocysteine lyase/cysteine desulfurase
MNFSPDPQGPDEAARLLNKRFEALRTREFSRLDAGDHVYLDYTGSGLYAESQLHRHDEFLEHHVLGNPHSENPTSAAATQIVENVRLDVLRFLNADPDEYTVVFTANASAALKLVGEAFPFTEGSRFTLLQDNHNSVQGIRLYAEAAGAEVTYLPIDRDLRFDTTRPLPPAGETPGLFAFPTQSNFSGVQHPLNLVGAARAAGYEVLLDTAAFVPTNPLDLSNVPADFVCVSFYKMFGFPTGLGVLVARHDSLARLRRPWFAGGTVEYVSVHEPRHRLRKGGEAFEDGTPNFLGIAAVSAGLNFLDDVGMEQIHQRMVGLTERLIGILTGLEHENGRPVVVLYGPTSVEEHGGAVSFNLLDPEGAIVPYGIVERKAGDAGISLREGCFCNPGAAEVALGLDRLDALECYEAMPHGSFSLKKLAECLDYEVAVGALRASVGIATNGLDLDRFESLLEDFRG